MDNYMFLSKEYNKEYPCNMYKLKLLYNPRLDSKCLLTIEGKYRFLEIFDVQDNEYTFQERELQFPPPPAPEDFNIVETNLEPYNNSGTFTEMTEIINTFVDRMIQINKEIF